MRAFVLPVLFCVLSKNHLLGYGSPVSSEEETTESSSNHQLLSSLTKYHLFIPYQLQDGGGQVKHSTLSTEHPDVTGIHKTNAFFVVDLEDTEFTLNLTLNHDLLPHTFATSTYSTDDNLITKETNKNVYDHCYYQGEVNGIPGSQVVLSTCRGLRGCVILPDDFFIIEPLAREGSEIATFHHVIYRPSDKKQEESKSCGNKDMQQNAETILDFINSAHLRQKRGVTQQNIKYVELMIVADSYTAKRFSTTGDLEAHVKELINYVDAFYHKLGMRIVLAHLEIWKNADRVKLSANAQEALDAFLGFREAMMLSEPASSPWVYADNFHLLYGRDFDEVIVGIASSGTMCTSRSGGVNQDTSANVINTAVILAHEIGHNFGMAHDTAECSCPTSRDNCIMAESTGYKPPTDWSSCSHAYLENNVKFGTESCLLNIPLPNRMYFVGVCGNDIVEEGEECDCGHTYDCTSTCCNASSCTLLPGAQCDGETCCSNCRFKTAGTLCRDKISEQCDLVERCTGNLAHCPDNLFLENGSPCDNHTALCVEGVCLNFDVQCESTWGPGSVNSNEICYTELNARGDEVGNCGYNQTEQAFIACSRENARCGKLQCSGGGLQPVIDQNRASYSSSIGVGGTGETFVCKTIASEPALTDVAYQGLVRDGTKCAENKVCSEGRCISSRASSCPFRCYGHGHCSNDGHCHCDVGWEQPYCRFRGTAAGKECGNHVVDDGEECDCGHIDECNSLCCNASTCRLLPGAECDSGVCCADCQYLKSGTICRGRNGNVCDLYESCTGTSANCPGDVFKQDRTLCHDGKAMCYQGICFTRERQCNEIWGGSSLNSADLCYTILNARGGLDGNCGFDAEGNFRHCSEEDVFCGTLQCQRGAISPIINGVQFSYQNNIVTRRETLQCKSVGSNKLSSNGRLLGSVKDGTMCGPEKMCMKGVCQKLTNTSNIPKKCECNGHGHCDNFDHCHCNPGWAAPDCATRGTNEPECGDHSVDEGEECDCGHPNVCRSKCCDPITCRLLPGAVCDGGVCCDKCQFVSGGTVCRETDRNECDLPEYCTGYSAKCPSDVFLENGSPCSGRRTGINAGLGLIDAFCYDGSCRTHDLACQDLWGKNASSSADVCYTYVNAVGNMNGNCGPKNTGGFSKCSKKNALCGKLQCHGGEKKPNTKKFKRAFNNRLTYGRKKIVCKTIASPRRKATFENDAGLVKDGTVCAPGKMCYRGKCITVSNSTCSSKCNRHGVCNHLGHCHCDRGWAPPHCITAGAGGSVDSEVIKN